MGKIQLAPEDAANRKTEENTHPAAWKNPKPAAQYDLVVFGGGVAGLTAAMEGALLGAKVALVEERFTGGESLTAGSVPSKCLMRSARAMAEIQGAEQLGVKLPQPAEPDFAAVMARMRAVRARISPHDSATRLQGMGVDVFYGPASFSDKNRAQVGGNTLRFKRAIVATGTSPALVEIENPDNVHYLTNETVFSLMRKPERLVIVGGGSTGCELAQIFRRLGSAVTLVQMANRLLVEEEAEAATVVQRQFGQEEIQVLLGSRVTRLGQHGDAKRVDFISHGEENSLMADEVLLCCGRSPKTEGLHLEAAGVHANREGIVVNDQLQTSNPAIYAAGDVCLTQRYTHIAEASARLAAENALLNKTLDFNQLILSHVTFTDPEIAQAGLRIRDAEEAGIQYQVYTQDLSLMDRAIMENETAGFIKIMVAQEGGKIIGATIVARQAGEMLGTLIASMKADLSLDRLAETFFPYPTQSEAIQKTALDYVRSRTGSPIPPLLH